MRLTFSVTEAAQALGVSRTLAYELAHTGQLRTVKLGRRLVVPRSAVTELLERPPTDDRSRGPSVGPLADAGTSDS